MTARLPIHSVLPELIEALRLHGRAVLQAPPGAGKTTVVPLAMLEAGLTRGRILMLEPRRLAARASAERMAQTLGEEVGETVGYRMRGEAKVSKATRIEVVTEGILTRMIQSDSELTGIGAVIFDEFHERSLNADLGLALAWELRGALRPDLIVLAMSATLDAGPVADLMDKAPIITAEGLSFPVELVWADRPLAADARFEAEAAALVARAVAETDGGVLVFLPGESEIRRVLAALAGRLPKDCDLRPLYGALPFAAQRAVLAPATQGRKIVLATAIAETSLTIPDIEVVVDAGRARRARFDPASGMSRLVTERVTRAEATQRAGRAGRVRAGRCYRLWTRGEDGALAAFAPPEITVADLTGLALELALWGGDSLPFLTAPPAPALAEARALLRDLGALDGVGGLTAHGRAIAALPLHPRLAHMLLRAGRPAAPLAALLADRDPLRGGGADLVPRLALIAGGAAPGQADRAAVERIRVEARRLARGLPEGPGYSVGQMAALAYPDRIGQRRKGTDPRYVLSGGKGAVLDAGDPLAGMALIVATDLDGDTREARVRLAAAINEGELREVMADRIEAGPVCQWSSREQRVLARLHERIGAVVLSDKPWQDPPAELAVAAMLEGVRELGLRLSPAARRFRARVELVRAGGDGLPDLSDEALMADLDVWLAPHLGPPLGPPLGPVRTAAQFRALDLLPALRARLDWGQLQRVDAEAPGHFTTPLGRSIAISYDGEVPEISIRLQEMFGVTRHPSVGKTPIRVTLLSPGSKPVQVTTDIPGFWAKSYAEVRKEMRGRYPRHPWPEDPTVAEPTLRAKPRGT